MRKMGQEFSSLAVLAMGQIILPVRGCSTHPRMSSSTYDVPWTPLFSLVTTQYLQTVSNVTWLTKSSQVEGHCFKNTN